jgi:hypothetical protein
MNARKQYLNEVWKEYGRADKAGKGKLLDEAERRTGMNRKYLIRWLSEPEEVRNKGSRRGGRRKRARRYGAAVLSALVRLWEIFDYACGQRLAPVLKREVERLRQFGELRCSEVVAERLRQISAKTIDRVLAGEKRVRGLRRNRNPGVQRLLYERVPVKVASDWDTRETGNLQVDFVAHCGRSTGGDYIHTISA